MFPRHKLHDAAGGIVVASISKEGGKIIMTARLSKSIRDAQGRIHKRDETLTIVGQLPRTDFDPRTLVRVRFEDGSTEVVFSEEVELSSPEWVLRNNVEPVASYLV